MMNLFVSDFEAFQDEMNRNEGLFKAYQLLIIASNKIEPKDDPIKFLEQLKTETEDLAARFELRNLPLSSDKIWELWGFGLGSCEIAF